MAKDKPRKRERGEREEKISPLHPDTKKSIWFVVLFGLAIIFVLAATGQAGPMGTAFYGFFDKLFGWGYWLLPALSLLIGFTLLASDKNKLLGPALTGSIVFILASLGFIDILSPRNGGWVGIVIGYLKIPFGIPASIVITVTAILVSFLVIVNRPFNLNLFKKKDEEEEEEELDINLPEEPPAKTKEEKKEEKKKKEENEDDFTIESKMEIPKATAARPIRNYVAPPLDLLVSTTEKPTIGDLRANANVIKRTLDGFGIPVEMGEINVGPTVTRYTLKPAEGIKLSRITALHQDLALALAAHPIRIEAPIPGKSLVGIEVPNKAAAVVRLGSLLLYPEAKKSGDLAFALGRNVSGEPIFKDVERMPHLLVAGATGSGKSIMIHSIIISLLYRNSPEMLRFIMIDPKRVELSVYNGIPHLLSPVITENKKSIAVLRWAIQEMDRRYQLLLAEGSRDIKSYNKNGKSLPYLVIVIDELADLMTSYGREVEGSIIRLAQMARATGIHLIVSTQRPSVEVITGLIKANITSRIALQVASQVDSRTILDTAGAEKLLGSGDALFIAADISKPLRIQGAYITEEEIKRVTGFIKKNNESSDEGISIANGNGTGEESLVNLNFDDFDMDSSSDELLGEAIETVRAAKKASASLLQRRLKVGYARAARLLDIMEEKGIIGPGDGAKPREVFYNGEENGERE
ncbi:MAG: DNA translocase FtsK [Minisyncoccia bacterium]|jgi:S-DNA-T family DNA segregation ATPase FtsK/SpoIIIE